MSEATPSRAGPLAAALARLAAAPGDDAARLGFHAALGAAELVLWLEHEPEAAGRLTPRVFALETGPTALAFDSEDCLAGFAGAAVPYAALPGRVLVTMLAGAGAGAGAAAGSGEVSEGTSGPGSEGGRGLSLLVQAEGGGAELLDPEALTWLAALLSAPAPTVNTGRARDFGPPELPAPVLAALIPALETRLSGVPGLAAAMLAMVDWQDGSTGHALAIAGIPEAARAPLARAVAEAVSLSGAGLSGLDVVFPTPAQAEALAAVGRRLHPAPYVPPAAPGTPMPPGMDPARPPRLR